MSYDFIEYTDVTDEDAPDTEICSECMCEVTLDSMGERECSHCNPAYLGDAVDEDGVLQELDFHQA